MDLAIVQGAALVGSALIATGAAWPARRSDPWSRAIVLVGLAAFDFALPFLAPEKPVFLRGIVVVLCPVAGGKLLNFGVEAGWWQRQTVRTWVLFLMEQLVLVPRLHVNGPGREGALGRMVRGLVEVGAGVGVLWWAFHADLPFWPDHVVKAAGAYLCFFDGMFVLREGIARLCGMRMLRLSRDPILAVTPADFWRRYNCEAGRFLREDMYEPLRTRIGKAWAIAAAFVANGLLHEYLAYLMVGRVQGYQLAFFAVHGAAVLATWRLRPRGAWAVVGRISTVAFVVVSLVLFFASVQGFMPFYARGGILP